MDVDAPGPNLMRVQENTRDLFDSLSMVVWIVRIQTTESESGEGESGEGESDKGESGKGESGKGESDKGDEGDDNDVVCFEECYADDLTPDDYDAFDDKEEEVNGGKNKEGVISLTAVAVAHTSNCAYLLTCAHGGDGCDGWYTEGVKIRARPLEGPLYGGTYKALVVAHDTSYDSCLLKVCVKLKEKQVASWGDGRVEIGETVYLVGHPLGMLGTGVIGNACYSCEKLDFHLEPDDKVKCKYYLSSSWQKPAHRVMGNLWNAESLYGLDVQERKSAAYDFNYLALLPIIQCSGLAAGSGASGSPIFNNKKEFIGMHVAKFGNYQIAVHVSALLEFVDVSLLNLFAKKETRLEEKIEEQQQGIEKQPFKKRRN